MLKAEQAYICQGASMIIITAVCPHTFAPVLRVHPMLFLIQRNLDAAHPNCVLNEPTAGILLLRILRLRFISIVRR